jgi:membrane protein implicated in regulation of membrane protease activity
MEKRSKFGFILLWFVLVFVDIGLMWVFGFVKDMNIIWITSNIIGTAIFVYLIYRYVKKNSKQN